MAVVAHAQDSPWSGQVSAMSAWVVRGLQLSEGGRPLLLASVDAYDSSGWSGGLDALSLRSLTGVDAGGWALRLRRDWSLDDRWAVNVGARHDGYVGDAYLQSWCYNEIDTGVSYRDVWSGRLGWRSGGGPACPAASTGRSQFVLDVGVRWPLPAGIALDAGAGRLLGRSGTNYSYGQWGVSAKRGPVAFHVANTWTRGLPTYQYGSLGGPHWIAGAVWQF